MWMMFKKRSLTENLSSRALKAGAIPLLPLAFTLSLAFPAMAEEGAVSSSGESAPKKVFHADSMGFYPIWENTGNLLPDQEIYLGTNGAGFGAGGVAQVGVHPVQFMYRAPNAYTKFRLLQRGQLKLAVQVGAYYLLEHAGKAFLSPMYTSRLNNPDFSMTLVPATLGSTYSVGEWLQLHQSVTALTTLSNGPVKNEVTPGYSLLTEFVARARHSVVLHLSEIGFWKHDMAIMGASYRYSNSWLEFRLGYFYRIQDMGTQHAPLIGLGFRI